MQTLSSSYLPIIRARGSAGDLPPLRLVIPPISFATWLFAAVIVSADAACKPSKAWISLVDWVSCPPTSGGKWELRRQSSLRGPNNSMSIKLRELIRAVRACNTITKATWTPHYIALRQNRPRRTCRNSERMRLDSYSIQRKCNACASSKRGEIALHPHAWCVLIIMHAHITVSRLPQSLWSDGMPEAYSFTKLS